MDKSKKFVILFPTLLLLMVMINCIFNYTIDPFGIKSTKDKFVEQLNAQWTYLYKPKILQKQPYYLLGTSRSEQIDNDLVSNYLNKHMIYLGMSNQTLNEALFLIEQIKANKNNFISGFDVIEVKLNHELQYNRLEEEFELNKLFAKVNLYINPKTTQESIVYIIKKILGQKIDTNFIELDNKSYLYSNKNIDDKVKNDSHYKDYQANTESVMKLAKLADSDDIIIIFPKFATYYKKFQEYYDIENQYFNLIKILVNNTNAKIWSFYGINEITTNKDNFDNVGWHFKPKVGKLMFARIFNDTSIKIPQNFGFLLDKNNVDKYLESLHNEVRNYKE